MLEVSTQFMYIMTQAPLAKHNRRNIPGNRGRWRILESQQRF